MYQNVLDGGLIDFGVSSLEACSRRSSVQPAEVLGIQCTLRIPTLDLLRTPMSATCIQITWSSGKDPFCVWEQTDNTIATPAFFKSMDSVDFLFSLSHFPLFFVTHTSVFSQISPPFSNLFHEGGGLQCLCRVSFKIMELCAVEMGLFAQRSLQNWGWRL